MATTQSYRNPAKNIFPIWTINVKLGKALVLSTGWPALQAPMRIDPTTCFFNVDWQILVAQTLTNRTRAPHLSNLNQMVLHFLQRWMRLPTAKQEPLLIWLRKYVIHDLWFMSSQNESQNMPLPAARDVAEFILTCRKRTTHDSPGTLHVYQP